MDKMYVIAIGLLLVTGASVGVVAQNDTIPAKETDGSEPAGNESEGNETAETITICHVPPGNPDARHTIEIGEPAWQAHESHGDNEGACEEDAEAENDAAEAQPDEAEDENETEEDAEGNDSEADVSDEGEEPEQENESETEDGESEETEEETNESTES